MNVTLNDQGRKEFQSGREEVKPGHGDRTQSGEIKLFLLGVPGLCAPCRTHWDTPNSLGWRIPCPMETLGHDTWSWCGGIQTESSFTHQNNPNWVSSHHLIPAEPSLGMGQADCCSLPCNGTRKGILLGNPRYLSPVWSQCQLRFYICPLSVLKSWAAALPRIEFPKHRALTKQPPVHRDKRQDHSAHGSLSFMGMLLNL